MFKYKEPNSDEWIDVQEAVVRISLENYVSDIDKAINLLKGTTIELEGLLYETLFCTFKWFPGEEEITTCSLGYDWKEG